MRIHFTPRLIVRTLVMLVMSLSAPAWANQGDAAALSIAFHVVDDCTVITSPLMVKCSTKNLPIVEQRLHMSNDSDMTVVSW